MSHDRVRRPESRELLHRLAGRQRQQEPTGCGPLQRLPRLDPGDGIHLLPVFHTIDTGIGDGDVEPGIESHRDGRRGHPVREPLHRSGTQCMTGVRRAPIHIQSVRSFLRPQGVRHRPEPHAGFLDELPQRGGPPGHVLTVASIEGGAGRVAAVGLVDHAAREHPGSTHEARSRTAPSHQDLAAVPGGPEQADAG